MSESRQQLQLVTPHAMGLDRPGSTRWGANRRAHFERGIQDNGEIAFLAVSPSSQ